MGSLIGGNDRSCPANRISLIDNKQSGVTVTSHPYEYDKNGNRIKLTESNIDASQITTYEYDDADRLTKVFYPTHVTSYTLDKVGNRDMEVIDRTGMLTTRDYGYNERDQLTSITDTDGLDITYDYDAFGNQTEKTENGILTTFDYTPRQRVKTITVGSGQPNQYEYDYAGQRVNAISASGTERRYLYDGLTLIAETNTIGNTLATYHYGTRHQLAETRNSQNAFYLADALGTTVAITNQDGSIQNRMDYDVWGNLNQESATSASPFGFTGYIKDEETDLYYANARYYDSFTGRFLREDPLNGDVNTPPSLHRYLYGYANPTYYIDPTGEYGEEGHYYTTYFVALAVGYNVDEARELAIFSQFPDEVEELDAISVQGRSISTASERVRINDLDNLDNIDGNNLTRQGRNNNLRDLMQENLHSLTGGKSKLATAISIRSVLNGKSLASTGVAIHFLADSFSHRIIGNEEYLYPTGFGHLKDMHDPDLIHLRPELYLEYVTTLASTLAEKRGLKGEKLKNAISLAQELGNRLVDSANDGYVNIRHARKVLYGTNDQLKIIDDMPGKHSLSNLNLVKDVFSAGDLSLPRENIADWVGKRLKRLTPFSNRLKDAQIEFILPYLNSIEDSVLRSMTNEQIYKSIEDKLRSAVRETVNNNERTARKIGDNLTEFIEE